MSQFWAAANITAGRHRIEGPGDAAGFNVLQAVRACLSHGLVAPLWLVYAYNKRFDRVLNYHVGSWDHPDAFGLPNPKGSHLAALRKARLGRLEVSIAVHDLLQREPATPIDKALFERVGRPLGFGATLTERYYYEGRSEVPERLNPKGQRVRTPAKRANFRGIQKRPR